MSTSKNRYQKNPQATRGRYNDMYRQSRMMRQRHDRQRMRIIALLVVAVLLSGGIAIVRNLFNQWQVERTLQNDLSAHANTFEPNVTINGVELTGYSYEEASDLLNERYAANLSREVLLTFQDKSWTFTPTQVGAQIDLEQQLQTAWAYGKVGTDLERQQEIHTLREQPVDLSATLTYDMAALEAFVENVRTEIDCDPVNATRQIVEVEKFEFTDSAVGYRLNTEVLQAQLSQIILEGGAEQIELEVEVLQPSPSREELEAATVLLGECTTSLSTSSRARNSNVNLALGYFNMLVVEPGETVSFNDIVGKRTKENNFKEAPEFSGTTVVTGIGGGVCQASTTIYGAILHAGLEIIERHPHTMTVSYVAASQDAAVNNDDKDLCFKNNTEAQIFIFAGTDYKAETATVKIYGKPIDTNVRIEIVSDITQMDIKGGSITYIEDTEGTRVWYVDDPPVLYQEGKPGMRSAAYRVYYDLTTGQEIRREKLSSDYYAPQNDVYLKGVHERE